MREPLIFARWAHQQSEVLYIIRPRNPQATTGVSAHITCIAVAKVANKSPFQGYIIASTRNKCTNVLDFFFLQLIENFNKTHSSSGSQQRGVIYISSSASRRLYNWQTANNGKMHELAHPISLAVRAGPFLFHVYNTVIKLYR